jgi:oxygen-independent coproporphyrinogen-3 oxidase
MARHRASSTVDPDQCRLPPAPSNFVMTVDGTRIAMTERGRPFVRLAAATFDAYLRRDRARHSATV